MPFSVEKNIAIVSNPLAGAGRADMCSEKIRLVLASKKIVHTIFITQWPKNFNQFTDIFIVGGDGTLNYFINHYRGLKLPLVIFRGFTGNDFHWLLYGDINFDEQLQIALTGTAKPIDIAVCNDRYFINGVGIGFEGEVVKTLSGKKKLPGKTSFLLTILKKIFSYRSKNYSIEAAGERFTGKKLMIDISNGRRAGRGFLIAPLAKANDGLLDVVIVNALTSLKRLRYLSVIERGHHLHLPFIHHFNTTKISVKSNEIISYHADGEYFEAKKIMIEILPATVNFRY